MTKTLDEFDFDARPSVNKPLVLELARGDYLDDAHEGLVDRIGKVLRDLLLDRAALLLPLLLGVSDAFHAGGVQMQCDVEVGGRDRFEVLGDRLLRIRVPVPAELCEDRRGLIGVDAVAAAESHMLLRVGHPGEAGRRFVGTDEVIVVDGNDRRQRIANDDDAQAIVERGSGDVPGRRGGWRRRYLRKCLTCRHRRKRDTDRCRDRAACP